MDNLYLVVNETYWALFYLQGNIIEHEMVINDLEILNDYHRLPISIILNLKNTNINCYQTPALKVLDRFIYFRNLAKQFAAFGYKYHKDSILEISVPALDVETLNKIPNPISKIFSIPVFADEMLLITKHQQYLRHSYFKDGQIEFTRYLKQGISSADETMAYIKHQYNHDARLIYKNDRYLVEQASQGNCLQLKVRALRKIVNEPALNKVIKSLTWTGGVMWCLYLGVFASEYYQNMQLITQKSKLVQRSFDPMTDLRKTCKGLTGVHQLHWQPHKLTIRMADDVIEVKL